MDTHTVTNVTNVTSTQRADDPVVYTTLGLSLSIVTFFGPIGLALWWARRDREQRTLGGVRGVSVGDAGSTSTLAPPQDGNDTEPSQQRGTNERSECRPDDGYRPSTVVVGECERPRVTVLLARKQLPGGVARTRRMAARQAVLDRRWAAEYLLGRFRGGTQDQLNDVRVTSTHVPELDPVPAHNDGIEMVVPSSRAEERVGVSIA
jgi:hypothetical protein